MTVAISFLPPIFEDEYDGVKMRSLVAELERLHAEVVRGFDTVDTTGNEANDLSVIVTWANVPDGFITQGSVTQHEAAINHDALTGFLSAEHVDWAGSGTGTIHATNVPEGAITQHEAALSILEDQIVDANVLARIAGDETITGQWDFTKSRGSPTTYAMTLVSAAPFQEFDNTGSAADEGSWAWGALASSFVFRTTDDSDATGTTWLTVNRTSEVVDNATFGVPIFATSYDGVLAANLLDKTVAAIISAEYDFTTNPKIDAAGIDSGTFANGRIAVGNVTQHEASIDHDALTNFLTTEHYLQSAIAITAAQVTSLTFANARIAVGNVTQHEASIDHDALTNFLAAEHVDWAGASAGTIHTTNFAALQNIVEDLTPQLGGNLASNSKDILMADNDRVGFGDGVDGQIHFSSSGNELRVTCIGTTSFSVLLNATETAILAAANAAVSLFYNGSQKLITASDGIDVTGDVGGTTIGGIVEDKLVAKDATETIAAVWDFTTNPKIDAAGIDTGAFADARIAVGNVTQHVASIDHDLLLNFASGVHFTQAAISITGSQVTSGTFAGNMKFDDQLLIKERGTIPVGETAYGVIWVDDSIPNKLFFTNDASQDFALVSDLVDDASPQLGGNLQSNAFDIHMADGDKILFGDAGDMTLLNIAGTSTSEIQNLLTNAVLDFTFASSNKISFDGANKRIDIRDGWKLRIRDTTDIDFVDFSHTGTDFLAAFDGTTTTDWDITGLQGALKVGGAAVLLNIVEDITPQLGGNLASNSQDILMADNDRIGFGDSVDGQIHFSSSGNEVRLTCIGTTGFSVLLNATETAILAVANAGVALHHNGSQKIITVAGGVDVTASLIVRDTGSADHLELEANATNCNFKSDANPMHFFPQGASVAQFSINAAQDRITVGDGNALRIAGSVSSNFADFTHDNTDFNTAFTSTVDWNLTGITALRIAGVAVATLNTSNLYVHPAHPGDDFSVDSGALTGANVISDIDINVTTDAEGHVTDANGVIATRALTAANIGAAPTTHNHTAAQITSGTLLVARGGTGVTSKTGTGSVVLSATPTFTGTPVFGAIRINNDIDLNGNIVGDGASVISGIETITVDGTGDITKASHGNYLYHQSSVYDDDQEGGITLSTAAATGGADGDIWFRYTA